MTGSFLLLLASCLPNAAGEEVRSPYEQALSSQSAWVIRAQSPAPLMPSPAPAMPTGPLVGPPAGVSTYYPPSFEASPVQGYGADPFANPATPGYPAPLTDPFSNGCATPGYGGDCATPPYAVPGAGPDSMYTFGVNGTQPVRFGWQERIDLTWIPKANVSAPAAGDFAVFGVDMEKIFTQPLAYNWIFSIGPQFNYRSWQGPLGSPALDMPAGAYRFGLDMRMRSPMHNGWAAEIGFNPSIATDMRNTLTSEAYLLDAHAVAFWRWSQRWMWAIGVQYWDRVDDLILPYAGAVWTPNDIWEFRLIFPKPRISVFVGTPWGVPTWLYTEAEYHVEAYQIRPEKFTNETRVQLEDWRVVGGVRWETGTVTSFVEAGYIFDRQVEFRNLASDFDIDSGFIGRVGFRF